MSQASERLVRVIAVAAAVALGASARAEGIPTTRDITSVRAEGMADAARGFASGNEALLINPAGIAATTRFNLAATGMFNGAHGFRVLGIDAVDSQLNAEQSLPLSGGIGYYNYRSGKGAEARSGSMTVLGLALPLADVLFVGASAKYLSLTGAVKTRAVTADAALMLRPVPALSVSGIGYNLIDIQSPEARRAWAVGLAFGSDDAFHVDVDTRFDTDAQNHTVESLFAGAEYLIGGLVMPRAGYAYDALRKSRDVTGGVSLLISGLAIEGAYRHSLNGVGRQLSIDARILGSFL